MMNPIGDWRGRLADRALKIALMMVFLLPPTAGARTEISTGGGGGGDGTNGDPLDTNDFGSGGGSGGRRDDMPGNPEVSLRSLPPVGIGGHRFLLIPVNQGGLLTFRLLVVEASARAQEGSDAF